VDVDILGPDHGAVMRWRRVSVAQWSRLLSALFGVTTPAAVGFGLDRAVEEGDVHVESLGYAFQDRILLWIASEGGVQTQRLEKLLELESDGVSMGQGIKVNEAPDCPLLALVRLTREREREREVVREVGGGG
jgi:hypothetical protein